MNMRRPAEVFPPGEFLREELDERNWSQTDLADILDRPVRLVNEIIAGKRAITPETARGLARALGTSPEYWMNLESAYQLSKVRDDDDGVTRRAQIYAKGPIKEMIRRGWLERSGSLDVLEQQVRSFYELESIQDEPEFLQHAARKSTPYGDCTSAQLTWLFRARQLARPLTVGSYSPEALDAALVKLRALRREPRDTGLVVSTLAEAGVRVVIVQALPSTRIDGATFWLDEYSPVIALSLRFDRIDNFWFTLLHELDHVRAGDGSLDSDVGPVTDSAGLPPNEIRANEFAQHELLPLADLERFVAEVSPFYSATAVTAFAASVGLHPGVVVGQLQRRNEVSWSALRKLLAPIREFVISGGACTDGWDIVPSMPRAVS